MNFDQAFHRLLGHEGGYVNHPNDPGGETIWGITRRDHPDLWVNGPPSVEQAKARYRSVYWKPVCADDLPEQIRFDVFDAAVNSGRGNAVRWLQRAAGVADDGRIGPVTVAAVHQADPARLLARFNGHRLKFMASLSTWPSFGRGWANRVAENLIGAE
jgi:lysozyme family protein